MSLRANATKPKRNTSQIVDLQRKNLNSELTVTIPENEQWQGALKPHVVNGVTDYYYDISTKSMIAVLAENGLMRHFKRCFDQVKLISTHLCIDVSKPPTIEAAVQNMYYHRQRLEYQRPGSNEWIPVQADGFLAPAEVNALNAIYPPGPNAIITRDGNNNNPPLVTPIEMPFTIAAASRRTVPNGYFQWIQDQNYVEPAWDELMSYGSSIWETKMPGTSVHLSLDINGSSNSERMMTFPTEMLDKLYELSPMTQNGRFCPFIMTGIKIKNLTNNELTGLLAVSIAHLNPADRNIVNGILGYFNGPQFCVFNSAGGNINVRGTGYFDFTPDNGANQLPQGSVNLGNLNNMNYCCSVQGYHQVRFKQLRTLLGPDCMCYNFLGVSMRVGAQHQTIISRINGPGGNAGRITIEHIEKVGGIFTPQFVVANNVYFVVCYKNGHQGDKETLEVAVFSVQTRAGIFDAFTWAQFYAGNVATIVNTYDKISLITTGGANDDVRIPHIVFTIDRVIDSDDSYLLYENPGAATTVANLYCKKSVFYNSKVC